MILFTVIALSTIFLLVGITPLFITDDVQDIVVLN